MPRDVCARHVRRDDEDSADDRHGGESVTDGREKVLRGGAVGADDLADDGRGRAVERDADRAEEKDDGTCGQP